MSVPRSRLLLLPALLAAAFAHGEDVPAELPDIEVQGWRNAARYAYTADATKTQFTTKTATPVAQTPQSVSVVTRRHLDEREPQDVAETLAYTAGASGGYRGENGVIEMSVRGIGNKSSGGSQPTFLDGLRYAPSLEISPYVIDQIEVVKGPASVLYGQANPGGLVNLRIKQATGSDEQEITVKTGTGRRIELGADIDRAISDQLAYRLVADVKQMNWQAGENARLRSLTLAPSLRWRPNERTELVLSGLYERQPEAGDRNFLVRQGTLDAVDGRRIGRRFFAGDPQYHDFNNEKAHIGYRLNHRFRHDLSLHQNVRYGRYEDNWKTLVVWNPLSGSLLERRARLYEGSDRNFLADTRLQWQPVFGAARHDIILGVDYADNVSRLRSYLGAAPDIDWRNPVYGVSVNAPPMRGDERTRIRQTGIYLQDQMQWHNLHVLLGGRYDQVKRGYSDYLYNDRQSQSDGRFTWRAGALYRFANGLNPYVSYSTSFVPEAGKAADGSMLKPTTAAQWEAGVKYQPDPAWMLSASVFGISQRHLTVTDPLTRDRTQQGKVRTRGLEIEFQGDITPAWGISGNYTYLDKQVREDADPRNIGTTSWGVPRHSFSLWSDYRFSGSLNGLSAGIGVRRVGTTWGDNANTFRVPAYTLWDAKLAYRFDARFGALKGLGLQLNAQNIGNKEYVASCANTYSCFYGKGRIITLSGSYRW